MFLYLCFHIESEFRLRFLSVMVTRLLLSLKKAVATQERGWSFGEPTNMKFAERRGASLVTRDEIIHLDIFASTYEGIRSQGS